MRCHSKTRSIISPAKSVAYDIVVSCQNVADIYPALEKLQWRPPLIEHGGLVSEALAGPKHFTSRYVGVCRSIRDAAASKMPGREHHAVEIPSMVDLGRVRAGRPRRHACSLGIPDDLLVGWVGQARRQEAASKISSRPPRSFIRPATDLSTSL